MKKILKISIVFLFAFIIFNINNKVFASMSNVRVSYPSIFIYTGKSIEPPVIVKDNTGKTLKKGTDYKVSYSNNKNAGTGKIIITGLKKLYSGQITRSFTIKRKSITSYKNKVSLSKREFVYSGVYRKPSVYIAGLSSSDYKLEYSNNLNVGTAKLKIIGKGNYTDSITEYFKITKRNISDSKVYYDENKTYTYTGSEIKPNISKVSFGYTLKPNRDYTVKYSNNINAGTAKIQFTGKGNFTGTKTIHFTIHRKQISVSPKIKRTTYKNSGKVIQFPVEVYSGGKKLVKGKDYTLTYSCKYKEKYNMYYYSIKIDGKGNYKFHYSKTFNASKKNSTVTIGN